MQYDKDPADALVEQLTKIIDRQVALSVEAVWAGLHAGPDPKSVSFRHILNRIMILVQSPVTFVLFKEDEDKRLVRQYTFNKHPRHASDINARAREAKKSQMFGLFGTKYYLLVLEAYAPYEFEILPPPEGSLPRTAVTRDVVQQKLAAITNETSYEIHANFKSLVVASLMECNDRNNPEDQEPPTRLSESSDDYKHFLQTLRNNTTQYELDGYGVVDRVYRKIKKGIESISGNGAEHAAKLTNFILFVRDYAVPETYLRHEVYDYRLRILICSTQRSDLIVYFTEQMKRDKRLRRSALRKEVALWRYELKKKPYYKSIAKAAARRFFEILSEPNGGVELLRILEAPFGVTSRSMADPVFDGVTFFRDPFSQGGYNRCFPEKHRGLPFNELPSEQQDDVLRVTICRHLFDGMASPLEPITNRSICDRAATDQVDSEQPIDRLQIMLNPVELGGRIWCVIGHVTRSIEPQKKLIDIRIIKSLTSYWLQNYHIYQTINERAKKNLRVYMSQLYESTVGRIYKEETLRFVGKRVQSATIERAVNTRLRGLSCAFPYNVVQIKLMQISGGKPWPQGPADGSTEASRRAVFSETVVSVVSKQHNRVFPPAPSLDPSVAAKFVSETDIAVAMSDAILRGSIEAYGSREGHE